MKNYIFTRILLTKRLCVSPSLLPVLDKRKETDTVSQPSLKFLVIGCFLVNFWPLKTQSFPNFKKENIVLQ